MSDPVSLNEAKLFLRVAHTEEDTLIALLLEAAKARLENEIGGPMNETSPAPLRLALLYLVAEAFEKRGDISALNPALQSWVSFYKRLSL